MKYGKVLSQNNEEKFVFITKEDGTIVTKKGKLITAWEKDPFDQEMLEIIMKLFRK